MYVVGPRQLGSDRRPVIFVQDRQTSRTDYGRIWKTYRPRGYQIIYDDNLRKAYSSKPDRRITCPRPTTALRLCYALHEAMHIRLDPWRYPDASVLAMEYRTERLTLAVMVAEGVAISDEILRHCRYNVRKYLIPGLAVPASIRSWLRG